MIEIPPEVLANLAVQIAALLDEHPLDCIEQAAELYEACCDRNLKVRKQK